MTVADRPGNRTSVCSVRDRIERHLAGVSRYRALLAIDQTISELADHTDLVRPLCDVRDQIRLQLNETREYRALCAVDRIAPELADILAILDEDPHHDETLPAPNAERSADGTETTSDILDVFSRADAAERAAPIETDEAGTPADDIRSKEHETTQHEAAANLNVQVESTPEKAAHASPSHISDLMERVPQDTDETSDDTSASPPVAALAYNLANMLVQSLPPGQIDTAAAPGSHADIDSEEKAGADETMREGRAA